MEPTDRARYLVALLPYVMPKLNSVELSSEQPEDQAKKNLTSWLTLTPQDVRAFKEDFNKKY